jgi:hypothetical protein
MMLRKSIPYARAWGIFIRADLDHSIPAVPSEATKRAADVDVQIAGARIRGAFYIVTRLIPICWVLYHDATLSER